MIEPVKNSVARNSLITTAVVLGAGVFAYLLYKTIDIFFIFFMAVLLALFLNIFVSFFAKRKIPRPLGLVFSVLILGSLSGTFVLLFLPSIINQGGELLLALPGYFQSVVAKLDEISSRSAYLAPLADMGFSLETLGDSISKQVPALVGNGVALLFQGLSGIINLVAVVIFAIYLTLNPGGYLFGISRLFGPKHEARVRDIIRLMVKRVQGWIFGQVISITLIGVLYTIAFLIIGLPQAFFLGFLAGVMSFVPYIGTILGISIPAVLAFSQDPVKAVWVLASYVVIQVTEDYVVMPAIMRDRVNMPPLLTIIAVLVCGKLFGIFGMLIALPFTACVLVLFDELYMKRLYAPKIPVADSTPEKVPEE